jgi:hypothetical protein
MAGHSTRCVHATQCGRTAQNPHASPPWTLIAQNSQLGVPV